MSVEIYSQAFDLGFWTGFPVLYIAGVLTGPLVVACIAKLTRPK